MIRIKRGSHAYVLLCFMGLVGELPYKSLHLLGNAQTVRRVVEKMCVKEEYINIFENLESVVANNYDTIMGIYGSSVNAANIAKENIKRQKAKETEKAKGTRLRQRR